MICFRSCPKTNHAEPFNYFLATQIIEFLQCSNAISQDLTQMRILTPLILHILNQAPTSSISNLFERKEARLYTMWLHSLADNKRRTVRTSFSDIFLPNTISLIADVGNESSPGSCLRSLTSFSYFQFEDFVFETSRLNRTLLKVDNTDGGVKWAKQSRRSTRA